MNPRLRLWTPEEEQRLRELVLAGETFESIAATLGRSVEAVRVREQRLRVLPRFDPFSVTDPMERWSKGKHPAIWRTREQVVDALRSYARRHPGPLPRMSDTYNTVKKGDPTIPPSARILDHFDCMAHAWIEGAGVHRSRVGTYGCPWTREEETFLTEHAGNMTLKDIGARLNRSWPACKRRLYDMGVGRARDQQGFMSAAQVAKEYDAPYHRVAALIANGTLKAHHPAGKRNIWAIDPTDAMAIADQLRALKQTHKTENGYRTDHGDYRSHYGISRTRDGAVERIPTRVG